jgi:hypothetical protein
MSVSVPNNSINFLSSKEAGARSGYTSDYISRLAREGKVIAKRVGIQWFVEAASLENFLTEAERTREERKEVLRRERLSERARTEEVCASSAHSAPIAVPPHPGYTHTAHDVVEVFTAEVDESTLPSVLIGTNAHVQALLAVSVGTALAFCVMFSPALEKVQKSPAFALGAFVEMFGRSSWFVFPWSSEFAVAPMLPLDATPTLTPTTHQGIVVLPGTATEETITSVRNSFSDDVLVTAEEDGTGTIVPVFKDGAGDAYRFVIVPVAQPP